MLTLRVRGAAQDANARDQFGYTALMWAAHSGSVERGRVLIKAGADVNAQENTGSTALMSAARGGQAAFAKLLVDNKAAEYAIYTGAAKNIAYMQKTQRVHASSQL